MHPATVEENKKTHALSMILKSMTHEKYPIHEKKKKKKKIS